MLSLEECRKHLSKNGQEISDEELTKLRDQLYGLTELVLDDYLVGKIKTNFEIPLEEKSTEEDFMDGTTRIVNLTKAIYEHHKK